MPITPTVEPSRAPLRRGVVLVVIAALLSLAAAGGPASARQNAPDHSDLHAAYNAALLDSAVYRFSNLRPLKPLQFDPATKTVQVVQLTDFRGYTVGENALQREVWVTAVPEVQERCQGFSADLEMRLRQLLGLPPYQRLAHFVVMTVKQGDIFRPAADSDPTTTLPCACPVTADCGKTFPKSAPDAHRQWYAGEMLGRYFIVEGPSERFGYPWTRLGYTYDWKPGADKYGASEYVVRKGATVRVTEIIPYPRYCGFPE